MIRKRYVPQQKTPAYPNGARTPNETFQSPLRNLVLIGNCVHLCMRDEPLAVLRRGAGAVNAVVDAVLLAVAVILMAARKQLAACVQPASDGLLPSDGPFIAHLYRAWL